MSTTNNYNTGKRLYIVTFGCQMNMRDSEVIAGLLGRGGYLIVDAPKKADVVIFNTCSVRQHAEDKVWSEIGRIAKQSAVRSPQSTHKPIIGLVGCMAQNYKEAVFQRSPRVDFVVGPADVAKIPGILEQLCKGREIASSPRFYSGVSRNDDRGRDFLFARKIWETDGVVRPEEIYHTGYHAKKDHAFVVISEGCSNFCSYCVVPYTRGALRHRASGEILREVEEAAGAGITAVTLLGQNVNAYATSVPLPVPSHKGEGNKFIGLLRMVNGVTGLKEFNFITSHPKDASEELFRTMADLEKLKKYLHLPAQSGSDRILKLMNRGYTREQYLELARNYRTVIPGGVLTTDIIVGFPTETQEDFQATLDLVKTVEFDAGFIFKYSPRPHAAASRMPDDIPRQEKERRHARILELQKSISRKRARRHESV